MSLCKRLGVGILAAITVVSFWLLLPGQKSRTQPVLAAPSQHRPSWLREGAVLAGYVELPSFYRRRGGAEADIADQWKADFTDAMARRYKEMGVNLMILSLHKGAGLEAEAEEIAETKKFTEILHRYGIKVAGYVGATMFYETFYLEEPKARDWMQVTERGQPMYYGNQTFRHMACRNNPGYRAFIEKVLRFGIQDLKMDMFHFDQVMWWPQPWSCHCRDCKEQFKDFLRTRYSNPQQWKRRFGFARMEIEPPVFNLDAPPVKLPELNDPLMQEWARFRCASLAQRWSEYDDFIHKLNPDGALDGNPTMNPARNNGFINGVDLQQLMQHSQMMCTEEANEPRWTADGRLVSMIRSFKMARTMKTSLMIEQNVRFVGASDVDELTNLKTEGQQELGLAEALAYNDMSIGIVAGMPEYGGNTLNAVRKRYVNFFRAHTKDLADSRPVSDVAVLRSFASVEFNPSKGLLGAVLFEQSLIQHKIPFDIIFDVHLRDLDKYKVLVLADQDALSDEQVAQIRQFVRNGGGLVATGTTSLLTDWRTKREKFALSDLFGIDAPPARTDANEPIRHKVGKGLVVYIPRIEPAIPPPPAQLTYLAANAHWRLPKNDKDMLAAVIWAANNRFSANVNAPLWVTTELTEQKHSRTMLLHLLNFKVNEPLANIPVSIRIPDGLQVNEVALETPDGEPRQVLKAAVRDGIVSFQAPRLKVYGLVLLRLRPGGSS